jgi:hypothetical protein
MKQSAFSLTTQRFQHFNSLFTASLGDLMLYTATLNNFSRHFKSIQLKRNLAIYECDSPSFLATYEYVPRILVNVISPRTPSLGWHVSCSRLVHGIFGIRNRRHACSTHTVGRFHVLVMFCQLHASRILFLYTILSFLFASFTRHILSRDLVSGHS